MSKASAIVLSSGGLHSLVCTGLASREYRLGMLHLKDQRPAGKQAFDAFERQVAHFKPLKASAVDAAYFRQMALPPESAGTINTTGSDAQAALVPLRELQFLTVAAGFAQQMKASTIFWGAQYDQKEPDEMARVLEVVQVMNQLLELMSPEAPIQIKTPLMGLADQQVIELGFQMGMPFHLTWSCQMANTQVPCMSCPACTRRIRMFRSAQLADPLLAKK